MSTGQLILIVDDIEQNIMVLSHILRNAGYNVIAAFSGQNALKLVEKRRPDMILLDIMMPEMNGFDVCKKLKETPGASDIPVIFLSALAENEVKVQGLELGAVDYITKPFQEAEVLARVKVQLKIRQMELEKLSNIEELEELHRDKDRFIQIISHDLISPITGILLLSKMLKENNNISPEMTQKYGDQINLSSEKLLKLIKNILEYTKLKDKQIAIEIASFDLVESIANSITILQKQAENKNIIIQTIFDSESIFINSDESKFSQIINNLLSNSIKFTKIDGKIFLQCKKSEDQIILSIEDNGIGIPDKFKDKIFERYTKFQRSGTEGEKGNGLGLPIVKFFTESLSGKINIESKEDVGTKIEISFPINLSKK